MIRSDGTPTEGKRNRSDTEQVRLAGLLRAAGKLPVSVEELRVTCTRDTLVAHTRAEDESPCDLTKDER